MKEENIIDDSDIVCPICNCFYDEEKHCDCNPDLNRRKAINEKD